MGSGISKKKKKDKVKNSLNKLNDQTNQFKNDYHEDTNDAANLAIAICNKDESINVEMHISCEQLPTMDILGKTDAVVYVEELVGEKWIPKGRTEVIPENLNPKFLKFFIVPYNVEKVQTFRLLVYDIDNFDDIEDVIDDSNRFKQDYVGQVEFVLREVMVSKSYQLQKPLHNEKKEMRGFATIRCNEYDAGGEKILFHLGCAQFQSKNELFMRISSQIDGRTYQPIHRTENMKNRKNLMMWNEFEVPLSKIGIDDKAYCKLEVVEFYKDKPEQILGEFENTLSYFKENTKKRQRIIINSLFKGEIAFQNIASVKRISFITYLLANAQISLITAVDFTNSNKPQFTQNSLHKTLNPKGAPEEQDNQYSIALRKLNDILEQFDHDDNIPLYGFGAKLPPYYNVVSNCFALNGNYFNPLVLGSDGVVNTYKEKLGFLQFHGPTIFSEVIKLGAEYARLEADNSKNSKYLVLLIVTDSDPNDLDQMIDELVEASVYPISYLIVGLGDNPFPKMQQELKGGGSEYKIYSKRLGRFAERGNIHFFSFHEYASDEIKLARECLRHLPQQFLQYMEKRGIPLDVKRDLKTARQEYMRSKIDQRKKKDKMKGQVGVVKAPPERWIQLAKEEFKKKLKDLRYLEEDINYLIDVENIPTPDLNLFIEMLSLRKEDLKIKKQIEHQIPAVPKNQIVSRVAIPPKISRAIKVNPDQDKVGLRVYQVQASNQLDLIMKRKKKEINSIQKIFIKNIQIVFQPNNIQFPSNPEEGENKDLSKQDTDSDSEREIQTKEQKGDKKEVAANSLIKTNEALMSQALTNDLNQYFQNINCCLICNTNKIDTVFIPCGHAGYCRKCAEEELDDDTCPVCNRTFQRIVFTQFTAEKQKQLKSNNIL